MKKIKILLIVLIATLFMGCGVDYDKKWNEVEAFKKKGLPKSALEIVNKISEAAESDDDYPQLLKALIHKMRFTQEVKENAFPELRNEIKKLLGESRAPLKPVLHSILANMYWLYYNANWHRLTGRTQTANIKKTDDITTWSIKDFIEEAYFHYSKSLGNSETTQDIQIDLFDTILVKGDARSLRPTLYDFLAHRAIRFYLNSQSGLTRPKDHFTLDNSANLAPTKEFAELDITKKEPLSHRYHALKTMQKLLRFHLRDKKKNSKEWSPAPLVEVELLRLNYVHGNSRIKNKDAVFEKALLDMMREYDKYPACADIRFRLASLYEALGDNKTGKRRTTFFTKAQALCLETIKKYPGAYGSLQCRHLATEFECTNLSIEIETVNPVDTSILAKLGYLNTDTVHLKIFKLTRAEKINLCDENGRFERNESTPAYFLDKTPLRHWQINPPMSNDFNLHSLEIKIDGGSSKPGLPQGEYALLVSDKNKQDPKTGPVAFSFFSVSNIAYIQRNMRDKKNAMNLEFHILHRVGGQPLPHARVQVWNRHKDKENETETYKRGELLSADKNGFLSIPRGKHYNFHLEFIHDRDRLFPIHLFYNRSDHTPQPKRQKAHFFTDRAIYRPGQTIYFKGLLMELDDENNANHRILKNCKIPVYFYDVNYEKIAQLDLVTNQYGTFNGTFNAPLGKLNGKMTITNIKIKDNYYYRDNGVQVSVEEYKRPKFQVTLLDREETEPGKMVFKGKARAYSGAAIDNAEVVYRVKRYSKYLETASGKTVTAADGSFTIEFTDTKRNDLFCTYTVNVDVTDVNGETRSAEKQYYYGEPGLDLDMSVPQCVNRDANQLTVTITTRDRTGAFRAAKGKIEVFKLRTPARPFRSRPWSKPERIQPTPREFRDLFPVDTYGNEARMWNNSQKGDKPIYTATFDTGKKKRFILSGLQKWKSGRYTVRINAAGSIDGYSPSREFILYSGSSRQMPFITPNWFHVEKSKAEPGENAVIYIGSSFPDVHLIYETGCRGQREKKGYFKLNRSKRKILIPIRTHHRGGMEVHLTFVKHNRVYHREVVIQVPWTNKKLDISFSTFRNKLQPGAKEEWRLKIRGPKGSPWTLSLFAAEMVATLYDASLDTFVPHLWSFDIFSNHGYVSFDDWEKKNNFGIAATCVVGKLRNFIPYKNRSHDRLNWFGFGKKRLRSTKPLVAPMAIPDEIYDFDLNSNASGVGGVEGGVEGEIIESDSLEFGVDESGKAKDKNPVMPAPVKARTNLKETAFFKPSLRTTPQGDVFISFTIPESLTRWKMLGFAHTKDLRFGLISNELETRKELMVVPNTPRFFREGDRLFYTAKITSLHNKELSGKARLQLFDAATMQPVDNAFKCSAAARTFKIKKGQSVQVGWEIHIPENLDAVVCRAVASAGSFSDGEERAVPILKNRILVTESLPLPVKPLETRNFTFKKLLHSSASGTIRHHSLTLEFTANPLWYVVQALPYLVEYPWECMEQTFSRYYANRIASFIANSNPKIKTTLEAWKAASGNSANANALLSNLEKNKELKSLLLQETPWVRQGRDESQRKRQIARLFEKEKLDASMKRALNKLKDGQLPSGAWPWFKGMKPSPYITRHIICGFAHMMQLQVFSAAEQRDIVAMAKKAMPYLDGLLGEDYLELKKVFSKKGTLEMNHLQRGHIHYFYARSFFLESVPVESPFNIAFDYYYGQMKKYWTYFSGNKYLQGMMALAMFRSGDKGAAKEVAESIREFALVSPEMGMYWKNPGGYNWYAAPIESHALLMEVFFEILKDEESVELMLTWLLKQKQTTDWRTTKATVEACYALLMRGVDRLNESRPPRITLGKTNPVVVEPGKTNTTKPTAQITTSKSNAPATGFQGAPPRGVGLTPPFGGARGQRPLPPEAKTEAGSGYFKTAWQGEAVKPGMGLVTVENKNNVTAWGSLYWQYFEDLDKITPAKTPLEIKRELFVEKTIESSLILHPIKEGTPVAVGETVKVRIVLRVDRDMEYVHLKDMRASNLEPEHVLSGYEYSNGIGYYRVTKDASTNFFFDYLPKGVYVFEYLLRVTHRGDFSNGISSAQCMYAPEFTAHSRGIRLKTQGK